MSNELKKLVKDIQYKRELTIDQIAAEIGYTRAYLNDAVNKGTNKKIKAALFKAYPFLIEQNVSIEEPVKATDSQVAVLVKQGDLDDLREKLLEIEAVVQQNQRLLTMLAGEDPNEADIPGLSNKKQDTKTYKKDSHRGKGK